MLLLLSLLGADFPALKNKVIGFWISCFFQFDILLRKGITAFYRGEEVLVLPKRKKGKKKKSAKTDDRTFIFSFKGNNFSKNVSTNITHLWISHLLLMSWKQVQIKFPSPFLKCPTQSWHPHIDWLYVMAYSDKTIRRHKNAIVMYASHLFQDIQFTQIEEENK